MKILIIDYANVMEEDYRLTVEAIKFIIPDAEICIQPFTSTGDLYEALDHVDGLITAFLPLDKKFFEHAKELKCVSVSAVGYGNIDIEAAQSHGVGICHIEEYCTGEVSEHTMALICGLNRHLKYYMKKIENEYQWQYHSIQGEKPLSSQKLAIFGFGKIGRRVAELAQAFGMEVMAVDPYLKVEEAEKYQVDLVTVEEALAKADVISNHMNLTKDNYHFFNDECFKRMEKKPLFINVGRGACVDEKALVNALEKGRVRGAGLDVLEEEEPLLMGNPLLGRDNVLITPHSAFYSEESIAKLQKISGCNLAYYLLGEMDWVKKIVNV